MVADIGAMLEYKPRDDWIMSLNIAFALVGPVGVWISDALYISSFEVREGRENQGTADSKCSITFGRLSSGGPVRACLVCYVSNPSHTPCAALKKAILGRSCVPPQRRQDRW